MPKPETFPTVFAGLKPLMTRFAADLEITADTDDNYSLTAPSPPAYPKGLWFGAVQIKKNYVSYHLMPVYVFPDLLDDISDGLKKRMQGKSCFNFTKLDDPLVAELERLTERGFARYRQEQLVPAA